MKTLSIVVPGIRQELWVRLYNTLVYSCSRYEFEVIFVGPSPLPQEFWKLSNVKYVKDFGCPSRALQIGASLAEGRYITYVSDDCIARENALDNVLDNIDADVISLQYSESPGFRGSPHPIEYYNAWHHDDLKCKWVMKDWKIPIIFLMRTDMFYEYGGLDCRFEHINMNLHDMAFRMQHSGKTISVSKDCVWDADYVHRGTENPVIAAFVENDKPLFNSIWNGEEWCRPEKIPFDNWKQSPSVWGRRFT